MKKLLTALFCCIFFISGTVCADQISVAVASNFKHTLQKLAADFKQRSGHDVRISNGSSGKLFAQIKHGAAFDIFFSADEKLPDLLVEAKLAGAESAKVYALGKLMLLSNVTHENACNEILRSQQLNKLAIANPKIAPYGLAAKQVLQKLDLWQVLQQKLVMGENIAQTLQFVLTKSAAAGFVAQSLLQVAESNLTEEMAATCIWQVPTDLYAPIKQKMVLLNKANNKLSAQAFLQYIHSDAAKNIIKSSGYGVL